MTIKEFVDRFNIYQPVNYAYIIAVGFKLIDPSGRITVSPKFDPSVRFELWATISFGSGDSVPLRYALKFIYSTTYFRNSAALLFNLRFPDGRPPADWDGRPYDLDVWVADDAQIKAIGFDARWILSSLYSVACLMGDGERFARDLTRVPNSIERCFVLPPPQLSRALLDAELREIGRRQGRRVLT
jgi:hypothetical protein